MTNFNVCGSLLCILVVILIFALFISPVVSKRMFAGHVGEDTKKIVYPPERHFPGYVSLIYINVKDIQSCIRYLENCKQTMGNMVCLRFLYFFRIYILGIKGQKIPWFKVDTVEKMTMKNRTELLAVKAEFDQIHHTICTENGIQNINGVDLSGNSINILKPGEVSGKAYKPDLWGLCNKGESGGPASYNGKNSLTDDINNCPELYAHKELQPLREFILKNPEKGKVRCFYINLGQCGALGLTEDMFHGLTRDGLKNSSIEPITEVTMGSDLGNIYMGAPRLNLGTVWPRNAEGRTAAGECAPLSSSDLSETIVGFNSDARYEATFEYVKRSISMHYNGDRASAFTVPGIITSPTWAGIETLNKEPLMCRAINSDENTGCFERPQ